MRLGFLMSVVIALLGGFLSGSASTYVFLRLTKRYFTSASTIRGALSIGLGILASALVAGALILLTTAVAIPPQADFPKAPAVWALLVGLSLQVLWFRYRRGMLRS